ncbi:unnamed protein product [Paramecium pentaurelia]|uniref:Uncharacterized protein n=1 Tax=Paramecium pentaurelia TaxID=43138 RepID=A0A8S1TD78_9CILI|nr:unnamed protein product [Paramecium pentaurelia]
MYPGQFNLHTTDKNAMIIPPSNDFYHQPYILKLRNQSVFLDQIQGKEPSNDSYLLQNSERSQYQIIQSKMQELENLSLKQHQEFLSREIQQQQKELSKLWKFCQNHLLPPVTKPKQSALTDQEFQDPQYQNGFETKRAQSFEYQYPFKYDNQSDSISYKNTNRNQKQIRIRQKNSREFQNQQEEFSYLQLPYTKKNPTFRENKLKYRKKRSHLKISRLKVYFLFILAYIRWTKNYRQKRNQKIQLLKQMRQKYTICLEKIANQNVLVCKLIIKQWISKIIDPLFKSFSSNQFIQQSNENSDNPNSPSSIQNRQHQFIQLTNQVMKNMEKITEKDQIPEIIQTSLFLSLFKSQNNKAPIFVSKRTKYYTKNTIKIGNYQEKLIISEYFIFRLLAQHLIDSSNHIVYQNINHKMLCKFIILAILGILQIIFQDYFSELKQYDEPSTQLFQRRIKISKSQDISIITDDNIDQQQSLIYGLHDRQNFQNIIEKNQEWLLEIYTKFSKILSNLHSIL